MKYTPQEVIQFIQEEDVKFIRLAFCDCFGRPKNISIMPHELERAFKYGIAIDASAIAGFGDEVNSDLFLHPDASTIALLPWRPEHGSVVRMFCSITHPDGTPFAHDTRGILKQAVADAAKAGYAFSFGSELEFYLFRLDENGEVTDVPYDQATYMDVAPEDRCENVRREICLTLERMGIQPESSHHEQGPGQNEVDFRYSDPLSAADNAVTFLTVVKTIAARNGLYADFSPRPLEGRPGSGFHINMSVQGGAEALMHRAMGGILDKITESFLPFVESVPELKDAPFSTYTLKNKAYQVGFLDPYIKESTLQAFDDDPDLYKDDFSDLYHNILDFEIGNCIEQKEIVHSTMHTQEDDDDEEYFELNHASPDGIEEYGSEIEAHRIAMEDDEDDLDMLEGCAA